VQSFLHIMGSFDTVTRTVGPFTIAVDSDGAGDCAGETISTNNVSAGIQETSYDPYDGTTLDVGNGFSSQAESSTFEDVSFTGADFDATSHFSTVGFGCEDTAPGGATGNTFGFVIGD
jgi:hypothetical protein